MIKIILITITVAIVIFLIIASKQPTDFTLTRTTTIQAPASKIFPHINDLHQWKNWSPWAKLDPQAQEVFEGAESGVGAKFHWISEKIDVGEGIMTITQSQQDEFIKIDLDFIKPFKGHSSCEFVLKADGDKTEVSWSMITKERTLVCKSMGLLFNCEKSIEEMYDQGLANLKNLSETQP